MKVNGSHRTQAERTAATRAALIKTARKLFADKGFADVSTQAIVAAAGVTRGALYHQFDDKAALFAAVYEEVERDLVADIAEQIMTAQPLDPLEAMRVGARLFLDRCAAPDVQRLCSSMPWPSSAGIAGEDGREIQAGESSKACSLMRSPRCDTGPAGAGDGACAARSARRGGCTSRGPPIVIARARRWKPSATG